MPLFHEQNEAFKSNTIMFTPSPCKTTVFKPKMSGQKPKGLSMRSNSDMNVFHSTLPTSVKGNTYSSKELKISKPKIVKQDSSEHQTYSLKEQQKYSNREYQIADFEGLTSKRKKKEIDEDKRTEVLDDKIFKKPLFPKKLVKQTCEPENLAYFYDAQHKFDYEHIENMEQKFMDRILKEKENIIPCEEKDGEMLLSTDIPQFIFPNSFDEEYIELSSPELPYISDDDTS